MPLIFSPANRNSPMKVGILGSGSFSTAEHTVGYMREQQANCGRTPFQIMRLYTDTEEGAGNAVRISMDYGLPEPKIQIYKDVLRKKGIDPANKQEARRAYFTEVTEALEQDGVDLVVLAGYMRIVTDPLLWRFRGRVVGTHPADLRKINLVGDRAFVGDNAVRDQIYAGETTLSATVFLIDAGKDTGPKLTISPTMPVDLALGIDTVFLHRPEGAEDLDRETKENQNRLKRAGDWPLLALTLDWIGQGRFSMVDGVVHLDDHPIPNGYQVASYPISPLAAVHFQ